jgi:Family of unknown function (DUF6011)
MRAAKRRRPAPPGRPLRDLTSAAHSKGSNGHTRQDGYLAPDASDRHEQRVLEQARAFGYRLAVRCTRCGQWVVAAESVAAHMGPVCRAKVAADV